MKKIAGLVIILAVLILGGYYGMGVVTEKTLKRNIEVVNQSTGLTVKIAHYTRHWFHSSAAIDVLIHVPEQVEMNKDGKSETTPAQDYTMNVPVTIYHGPVIYTGSRVSFGLGYAESDFNLPKELVGKLSPYLSAESTSPKLKLSVFVNYTNQSRFQVEVPAFKLLAKEGKDAAEWLGMIGDINVSSDLKQISGDFTLDGISIVKDKMKGVLGKVTSDYSLRKTEDNLYLGQAGVSVPSLVVTQEEKPLFALTQFKARTENGVDNGLFESTSKVSLDKIVANDKTYGPGLLEMSIKNIDAKVLAKLNAQVNKMQHTSGAERQQTMFAMLPEIPKLLAQGPSFEISTLRLTVPEGDIDGHFTIALPKTDAVNPFQIMQKIEGDGKFQVPTAIVKRALIESLKQKATAQASLQSAAMAQMKDDKSVPEVKATATTADATPAAPDAVNQDAAVQQATAEADKKLTALVQAKVLVQEGQSFFLEFHLAQGKLTLNGQPFDPATFKF